jgi:hypothetical protein
MPGHRSATCAGLLAATALLAGCFTTTSDYRETAESFIVDDPSVGESLRVTFDSATCEEPANQDVGTVFACTAVDETGTEWEFEVEIGESDSVVITQASRS